MSDESEDMQVKGVLGNALRGTVRILYYLTGKNVCAMPSAIALSGYVINSAHQTQVVGNVILFVASIPVFGSAPVTVVAVPAGILVGGVCSYIVRNISDRPGVAERYARRYSK